MKSYIITLKDGTPIRHKPNGNIEIYSYMIFKTLEEAEKYVLRPDQVIRKCNIRINKREIK